jgi:4-coumarate--CoA ligase
LVKHPAVRDAGVTSYYSHPLQTEIPVGFVVLSPETKGKKEVLKEIEEWVAKQVVSYKKLRGGVWEVDALPRP